MSRTRNPGRDPYACSFCGRGQDEVQRLIAGPGNVFICDECVALCSAIIAEVEQSEDIKRPTHPTPWPVSSANAAKIARKA